MDDRQRPPGRRAAGLPAPVARLRPLLCAALLAGFAGCTGLVATSQSRLYALDAVPPGVTTRCPVTFSIRDVRIAGHLDRDEVVVGRDGPRVHASSDDVWAAPLKQELPRLLTRLLTDRLAGSVSVPYPWRFGEQPALALNVEVDRLDPVDGALQAALRWTVVEANATPSRVVGRGSFETRVPQTGTGAATVVRAIDVALGRFADTLAESAGREDVQRTICERQPGASRAPGAR